MSSLKEFDILLTSLPAGKSAFRYELHHAFFEAMDNADVLDADLQAILDITNKNDIYYLSLTLQGTLTVACDRCLEPLTLPVDETYELTVKHGYDYDDSTDGLLILPEREARLNVADIIYSTAILALPMRCVHPDGACDATMENILHDHGADNDYPEPEREEQ